MSPFLIFGFLFPNLLLSPTTVVKSLVLLPPTVCVVKVSVLNMGPGSPLSLPAESRFRLRRHSRGSYLIFQMKLCRCPAVRPYGLVEMMGFEPMTPCLQGRCSPN